MMSRMRCTGGEGTAGQERVDSLLGEGGCGMQLYLQAEMCRGLQWRYSLVVAGCNARNMPLKVHPNFPTFPEPCCRHVTSLTVVVLPWIMQAACYSVSHSGTYVSLICARSHDRGMHDSTRS